MPRRAPVAEPATVHLSQVDFDGLVPYPGEPRAERVRWSHGDGAALAWSPGLGAVSATTAAGTVLVPVSRVTWAVVA